MSLGVSQLNHVGLNVADVERSRRFYRDVVGLVEIARPALDFAGVWFRVGPKQELHLIGKKASGDGRFKECHFSLAVESIANASEHLTELGLAHGGPRRRADGAWQIDLVDPDGHSIELLELAH
jgi:catechol 2,3-dioxygenase-like lactoylglutathione lyase family enzyme